MNKASSTSLRSSVPAAPLHSHISGAFVRTMISLMILLTLGMVSLVFYRSQSVVEPTAAAVVVGDRSLDGTRIAARINGREIVNATLNAGNQYATPLLLQPGVYELEAVCGGEVLLSREFGVSSLTYVTVDLPTSVAIEGDASLDGAKVQLSTAQGSGSITVLTMENRFAAVMYRSPGRYHLTVTRDGRTVRDEDLTVVAHAPRRIALTTRLDSNRFSDESN